MAEGIISNDPVYQNGSDNTILLRYDVVYRIEDGNDFKEIALAILASDLQDVNDMNEVNSKINAMVAPYKAQWLVDKLLNN